MEAVDDYFSRAVGAWLPGERTVRSAPDVGAETLWALFDAQATSRHVDFAARWLQAKGAGYYTIGSAGHESNAALGLVTPARRPGSPALPVGRPLPRPGRAGRPGRPGPRPPAQPHGVQPRPDLGRAAQGVRPCRTSTSSRRPRPSGPTCRAPSVWRYSLGLAAALGRTTPWPADAIVLCTFGDASVNHSTVTGALNAASYLAHRGLPCPVLFVCEDNRIGISTPSPDGWPAAMLRSLPGVAYVRADGADPPSLLERAAQAVDEVRESRRPAVLHLDVVRFMGHAGSDVESRLPLGAARSRRTTSRTRCSRRRAACSRQATHGRARSWTATRQVRGQVMAQAERVLDEPQLSTADEVMAPLRAPGRLPDACRRAPGVEANRARRSSAHPGPVDQRDAGRADGRRPELLVFGEDVAVKGGVYGVTRGLRSALRRAAGSSTRSSTSRRSSVSPSARRWPASCRCPRSSTSPTSTTPRTSCAARRRHCRFFSDGQYRNGMVVRVAGLAYQRGFGGHFHNDNSVAVLRDIPGLVLAVPSHPADAPGCCAPASTCARGGRVCVVPRADRALPRCVTCSRSPTGAGRLRSRRPGRRPRGCPSGQVGDPRRRARPAAGDLRQRRPDEPARTGEARRSRPVEHRRRPAMAGTRFPLEALTTLAARFPAVLVVDETRESGGVAEAVLDRPARERPPRAAGAGDQCRLFVPARPGRGDGPAVRGRHRAAALRPWAATGRARRSAASG